jgi:hypothetical protein
MGGSGAVCWYQTTTLTPSALLFVIIFRSYLRCSSGKNTAKMRRALRAYNNGPTHVTRDADKHRFVLSLLIRLQEDS